MLLYIFIFLSAVVIYLWSEGKKDKGIQLQLLTLSILFLAFFVGLSDMLGGYDRYIYADLFDDVANVIGKEQPLSTIELFTKYPEETGYTWFNILIGLITPNRYIFILITTLVIYFLLFQSIRQYCNNYPFAIILFLGLWFFFTFTYLRQVLGATICWLGIKYIAERRILPFSLIWFIGWRFHNSAFIFLPMYFVPVKKFKKDTVIMIMVVLFVLGLTGLPTALFDAYGEVDDARAGVVRSESGFRFPYLVEAVFFLYLILSKYNEIPQRKLSIVLCNMAIIFCGILLFFIKSENGGRLSWYYMIGVISTISYLSTIQLKSRPYAILMIVVCFFLYIRIVDAWGIQLSPYKTFLTDGIRKGDYIEELYEYDHGYDTDKFYRPAFGQVK
jgi:hypothetical protein